MNIQEFKEKMRIGQSLIPILFSTPMVQAILNGQKTQTRRTKGLEGLEKNIRYDGFNNFTNDESQCSHFFEKLDDEGNPTEKYFSIGQCQYGKPGDILWVRETWKEISTQAAWKKYIYFADYDHNGHLADLGKWKPSIHMPFEACRRFLRIKSVRVEHLNDISEDDAKAEGVKLHESGRHYLNYMDERSRVTQFIYNCHTAKHSFRTLWGEINGYHGYMSWNANPWVWVIEFERVKQEDILMPF